MKVNGINSSIQSLILLLSPACGGLLLTVASLEVCFAVDVVTAIFAILLMFSLKVASLPQKTEGKAGYFDDLKEGIAYARSHPFFLDLLLFFGIFFFLIVPGAYLTPLLIARKYGSDVWILTANEVVYSGGAILGGIVVAAWGGFRNRLHTISFFSVVFGILLAIVGLPKNFYLYLIIMLFLGVCGPFINAAFNVLLQEKTDPEMHGRVFGFVQIVISTVMPVGMLVFGPLADTVKIEWLLMASGVIMAVTGVVVLFNRRLIAAGKQEKTHVE